MGEPRAVHLTVREYETLPDDGKRYEIIDGRLEVTPSPTLDHQSVGMNIASVLRIWVRERKLGRVFVAPSDVQLAFDAIVQPDVYFVSAARSSILDDGKRCRGTPDLAVEIFHHSRALPDTEVKRSLYARHGVPEYWLVDLDLKQVVVLFLEETGYQEIARVAQGGSVASRVLAGFEAPWTEIFRQD